MDGHLPLSLNERNERRLHSLSTSSRPPLPLTEGNPANEGRRRRLKKLAAASEVHEGEDDEEVKPPSFEFDFDSDGENRSPDAIRDVLDRLTRKLDSLSMQKTKPLPGKPEEDPAAVISAVAVNEVRDSRVQVDSVSDRGLDDGKVGNFEKPGFSFDLDEEDCVEVSNSVSGDRNDGCSRKANVDDDDSVEVVKGADAGAVNGAIVYDGDKEKYILPENIARMLYPHQKDGLKWLWSLHCMPTGGILGDDMGLGKTMQVSAFLAGLFHSHLIKRALIVAPKTLLPQWMKELTVVGLSNKIREYFATCPKTRQYELNYVLQDKGILLTTYDIVRTSSKALRGDSYLVEYEDDDDIVWDYVILDEGHIIKNPSTQRSKSLFEIPCNHRIIISGTPIQNNLKELWALFNFCCPDLLGDKKEFKERYENLILRGNDKTASVRDRSVGSTVAKNLREHIQPYFLRRLKNEVVLVSETTKNASLPRKHELIVWLRLTPCQRRIYEAFLKSELVLSAFDGSPLAALTILKKICDHPVLLTQKAAENVLEGMDSMLSQNDVEVMEELVSNVAYRQGLEDSSCKLNFILSLLDNLVTSGHNVLVFSQTRKMLNLIEDEILLKGWNMLRIDGTTKASERQRIVNDFQEGTEPTIFLLTSQVGGLGLTLTNADRVIVVDPAWNPSTDNQSVDRAYRIGQRKDVIVYRLMTSATIEEKIYRKQVFKGGLFKAATEHKEQTRYFSQRDLKELFSIPEQGFDVSLTQQQLQEEHGSQCVVDDSLTEHIKFLEGQGIAGVSHHGLLYSKAAPALVMDEGDISEIMTKAPVRISSSSLSHKNIDNGSSFAFNPKDNSHWRGNAVPVLKEKPSEEDIERRIGRLSQMLSNKTIILNLSDKGEKLRKQINELNLELDKIRKEASGSREIIDLDGITEKLGSFDL